MDNSWNDTQKAAAKQLFGRALRPALARWIRQGRGRAFYLQEAQVAMLTELGEAGSGVATELRRFASAGMLREVRDPSRVYFVEVPSPFWDAFDAIAQAIWEMQNANLSR